MTVKDVFEMEGVVTTCGIPALRDYVPAQDALMLTQLRTAGAVIYGKTNVPEGAGDHQSYNAIYGITRNPWNLEVTAGGSSGGAAAAVATHMTPLEVGSDVGGSIRCPAHFCGTFGHKPSHGLVPLVGHIPPEPGALRDIEMEVAGPLARSAYDLELLFDAIAAPNDLDRKGRRWDLPKSRHNRLQDFRVALWADTKHYPVDPGYLDAIHAFAGDLRRAGVSIDETARPAIDPLESNEAYIATLFGMWGGGLSEEAFQGYVRAAAGLDPADRSWPARIGRAAAQSLRDWDRLQERRARMRRIWEAFFKDYDVLLCPVMVTPAFPHDTSGADHTAQLHRTMQVSGERLRRGVFTGVPQLISAIEAYIEQHNENPKPFVWTASATEDMVVVGALGLMWSYPWLVLTVVVAIGVGLLLLLWWAWRRLFRRAPRPAASG